MKPSQLRIIALWTTSLGCSPSLPPLDFGAPAPAPAASDAPVPSATPAVQSEPSSSADPCASSKEIKLELLAAQTAPSGVVRIGLHNIGAVPACVLTHVATHEWQSDWLEIELGQGKNARSVHFNDDRDKSGYAIVTLAPGQTDWQEVDVIAWARRRRNGGVPLSNGEFSARARYDSSNAHDAWRGRLETPFRIRVR